MDSAVKASYTFVFINIAGYIFPKFWNHPVVKNLQSKLIYSGRVLLHICKKCLKETNSETPTETSYFEQESYRPIEVWSNKCPIVYQNSESYAASIFKILIALCFICIINWHIWNNKKKQKNPVKDEICEMYKNETCDKLKELHKILHSLNYQLTPPAPSKIPCLRSLHSSKECKNQILSSRNQLSKISQQQSGERKLNNEELRQNLQIALQLLEDIITDTKNAPSEIQKYPNTHSLVTDSDHNNNKDSIYESQKSQRSAPDEIEQRIDEWISNLKKNEAVLFSENGITDSMILPNLKEQKNKSANEEFSKHQTLLSSRSRNLFSDNNYFPTDHKKENPSLKSMHSNASSMTLQHLEKKTTKDMFATNGNTIKYQQEDISDLKNDISVSVLCELQSQLNKVNANSSVDQSMKHEEVKRLESSGFVYETKYHPQIISGLKTDERERTLYELEKEWAEMIRTPVKLNSREDLNMEDEQIKCFVTVANADNHRPQFSSYYMLRSEDTDYFEECLNKKEALSSFAHGGGSEDVTLRRRIKESKVAKPGLYNRCPENNKPGSTFQDLNLNELQPGSAGGRILNVDEFSKSSKRKDILNATAKKNTLNVSILFNHDIQLAN